jgi:hypothetical protein
MPPDSSLFVSRLLETGRQAVVSLAPTELGQALATVTFADGLRQAADLLCREAAQAARAQGASWREIGEAVGGITPQGAEHRFSPAAKERRSKASKAVWAEKERRAQPR